MSTIRGVRNDVRRELRLACWLIASVFVVAYALDVCSARYVPMRYNGHHYNHQHHSPMLMRRQDSGDSDQDDDETLDSRASSPYQQNQDEGNASGASDGYDDPEPDGPYEETPKDQEGQADLERFFDDHLGASERDGMDKENLPTELVYQLMEPPKEKQTPNDRRPLLASQTVQTRFFQLPNQKLIITRQITHDTRNEAADQPNQHDARLGPRTEVEMQVLMGKQQRGGPLAPPPPRPPLALPREQLQSRLDESSEEPSPDGEARDGLDARGSHIVRIDNEDDEARVYITNATNRPFRIDALGGYDPEEDFIDASREIEGQTGGQHRGDDTAANHKGQELSADNQDEPSATEAGQQYGRFRGQPAGGRDRGGGRGRGRGPEQQSPAASSDISFTDDDPEGETLFEDASETDEVTFGQEDPYQTDLEAEMRRQAFDKVGQFNADHPTLLDQGGVAGQISENRDASVGQSSVPDTDGEMQQPETSASTRGLDRRRSEKSASSDRDYDDDEGNWVNDGVEDMDIPSQSHQNEVLEKAAKREEAKKRADDDEEEAAAAAAAAPASGPEYESDVEAANKPPSDEQPGFSANGSSETPTTSEDENGGGGDPENQRMPNADYLKGDLREFDDSAYKAAA